MLSLDMFLGDGSSSRKLSMSLASGTKLSTLTFLPGDPFLTTTGTGSWLAFVRVDEAVEATAETEDEVAGGLGDDSLLVVAVDDGDLEEDLASLTSLKVFEGCPTTTSTVGAGANFSA